MPFQPTRRNRDHQTQAERPSERPTLAELLAGPAMLTIPEAGRAQGLGRSASYCAAKQGFLPTVQLSEGRIGVPLNAFLKKFWGLQLDEGGALLEE